MKTRIEKYWNEFFGLNDLEANHKGIIVVPHNYLEGYHGAWVFKRKGLIIISVPPTIVDQVKTKVSKINLIEDKQFSEEYLNLIFGARIVKIIGPTFQGYFDNHSVITSRVSGITKISLKDVQHILEEFSNSGDQDGWKNSGINTESNAIFGYTLNQEIVALAAYKIIKGDVGFIGLYTKPKFRGKGCSQRLVEAIVNELSSMGKLIIYQTLFSNKASIKVAGKIGFKEYGRNIAIRFKST